MTKLPRDVAGSQLIRALGRNGWYVDHQVGSHVTLRHPQRSGARLVVPVHTGKPLKPKVLSRIVREAGLTVEELVQLL